MEKRSVRIQRQRQERWERLNFRKIDLVILIVTILGFGAERWCVQLANRHRLEVEQEQVKVQVQKTAALKRSAVLKKKKTKSVMRTPINWKQPSETVPYPNLANVHNFWVKVSLLKNRTYLMSGKHVIYTMYCSGGLFHKDPLTGKMVSDTPTGTFQIQPEHGQSFYNAQLNEGANYWISWKDNGVYLFHSVPTKQDGSYNIPEAEKLGKQPASHGCIRLSVPDAKWMMENLKVGTRVVVQNN